MPTPDPQLEHVLRMAIEHTRLLRFRCRNKHRIVEPHDFGEHKGVTKLLSIRSADPAAVRFQLALDGGRQDLPRRVA